MTTKQKLCWVFGPSVVLVGLGGLATIPESEISRTIAGMILLPGWMLSVMVSDNPHQGFSGFPGLLVIAIGSVLGWAFVSSLLLCISLPLGKALRRHRV